MIQMFETKITPFRNFVSQPFPNLVKIFFDFFASSHNASLGSIQLQLYSTIKFKEFYN